ncbi:hypothetical protein [Mesorhizobium sp.]|uniref:hypothetical protein n=1 Tax=Mesorhizobium sp. TaxID=1871066 RepID=UPI000FEA442C|nr:hypothetical protein [Mesorhizobium sp.]RWD52339.1 MAG: hypothetical protein EOS75_28820 [Mesorhizobium sp.]RWD96651.1 MAG: hypothetical protein EOS40_31940 [Mesorhizobium sp.]
MAEQSNDNKSEQPKRRPSDIPLVEWVVAGIGALFFAAMLVFLGIKGANWQPSEPPMMRVEAQQVVSGNGGYVVKLEVINSADTPPPT